MVFGGRATFYIVLLCFFSTSYFMAFAATKSYSALKHTSSHVPISSYILENTHFDQVRDTTYYKKVLDSTKNNRLKLVALDSLVSKTYQVQSDAFTRYSEQYVTLAMELQKYDEAILKLRYYMADNSDRAYQFLQTITFPLEKVNDRGLVLKFLYYKGYLYSLSGRLEEAIDIFTEIYTSTYTKDSLTIMEALHERGVTYETKGEYTKAIADYTEAQQYFKRTGNYENMFFVQANLNVLYLLFGLEKKSIAEMKKVVSEKIKRKYTEFICYDYYNISVGYSDLNDTLNSNKYARLALDEALKKTNDRIELDVFYLSVADIYLDQGNLARAKNYLDITKKYLLKRNTIVANNYFYQRILSLYYLKLGRFQEAEKIALSLLEKIDKTTQHQQYKSIIYELLYSIYEAKGDYKKSLANYKAYIQLKDSVFSTQKANSLSYHQTLYETEKKEKEIASQELNLQSQERVITTQNRQRNYFMIGLSALMLILIGSFFFIKKIRIEKKKVAASLIEKELLLKEIHHRVKNNLQIVYGLMYKQARVSKDYTFKSLMEDAQGRIKSMAMIHQKLYQNNNFSQVDMKGYIAELIKDINTSFSTTNAHVDVTLEMAVTRFHMDIAIPLGLILNELITNIYKHAFNDGKGNVLVSIEKIKNRHQIKVKDNGVGLPENLDLKKSTSLGMNLITGLCHQIRATFNYKNNNGSEFTILLHENV